MRHRANSDRSSEYQDYLVWDIPTRLFHWVNVLAVLGLVASGLVILNDGELGLSTGGKILLKSVHVSFGYVMAVNLVSRFVWAFVGNRYARWQALLPAGPGYLRSLRSYAVSFLSGRPQQFAGHNPLARIGVSLLFLLLSIQLVTGLVIAGTDLYWPPFGRWFAQWVAAPGVDPAMVQPGVSETIDKAAYAAMRAFRAPIIDVHEFTFWVLAMVIGLHVAAVVVTEVHEGGSITSAMFTGRKILRRRPEDPS
jgi:Ni/Fe-hydrogenase 1 B-type cytochrome subunit